MLYNTDNSTVTVNEIVYTVERDNEDHGMTEVFTVPEFPGVEARIGFEQYIEEWMNPRSDYDGLLGVMVTSHRNYNFGGGPNDESVHGDHDFEVPCDCGGDDGCGKCGGWDVVQVGPVEWAQKVHGARVVLPLYVYEHSGITMSAGTFGQRPGYPYNDTWDAGVVGIYFDTEETRKACGWEDRKPEDIEADLRAEIDTYDDYLQGQVLWYRVTDEETGYDEGCGGYLGSEKASGALDECFSSLADACDKRLSENAERAEWAARDTVTA